MWLSTVDVNSPNHKCQLQFIKRPLLFFSTAKSNSRGSPCAKNESWGSQASDSIMLNAAHDPISPQIAVVLKSWSKHRESFLQYWFGVDFSFFFFSLMSWRTVSPFIWYCICKDDNKTTNRMWDKCLEDIISSKATRMHSKLSSQPPQKPINKTQSSSLQRL